MSDGRVTLGEAARAAVGRAGVHALRAGMEVLSGLSAVLEELRRVGSRRPEAAERIPVETAEPLRIEVD